jgi:hypothetical protein
MHVEGLGNGTDSRYKERTRRIERGGYTGGGGRGRVNIGFPIGIDVRGDIFSELLGALRCLDHDR